ncbi:OPT oligopeptide transporter protein-domain-containing protein [Leptodontidium sp. 2 PMI_412]|nr:OPT oligopeptide transporter protein-domain-containing protein [Leptodontidium sp. 2 PMI_412]
MESEKVAYATSQPDSQERDDKKTYSVDVNDNEIDSDRDRELEDMHAVLDNKFPFPKLHGIPDQEQQITFRAILLGCCLGAVVSASNIYLGLKTGWTFGASLFGSILGFAILKPLSKVAPKYLGGGHFGPKENVTVQSAATAAGGLGIIFVGAVPAMYQLGLLSKKPQQDMGKLITFSLCTAYYGIFFAIALRKFYILKLKLIFPSPTAVAYTIRALHAGGAEGEKAAARKAKVLGVAFGASVILRVVSMYAPGILWDHNIFWWVYTWGWTSAISIVSWGWLFEYTPAFLGAGILSGMNASLSFFLGDVLAWALIGPLTVKYGETHGQPVDEETYPGWMSYGKMSATKFKGAPTLSQKVWPSPRYWNLWIGVMIMLCASFAEVAMNSPMMYRGMKRAFFETAEKFPKTRAFAEKHRQGEEDSLDPSPKEEQVPVWAWSVGVVCAIAVSMIVLALQYNVSPGLTILAVILAFIFSFIAAQSAGATDINPVSTCAKASQLVFGGVTQGQGIHGDKALTINMTAGIVAGGAAAQSVDMLGDLRTGYLLSASPYAQFIAQAIGSFFSIFLCTGFFVLFSNAYPCIIDPDWDPATQGTCQFGIPSVSAWVAVSGAVTGTEFPVPPNSAITALCLGLLSIAMVVSKYLWIPAKYHRYIPNMNAVGLAFTLPQTQYATAMATGAILSKIWLKRSPRSWNEYAYSIAAGACAGEGIGGVINALFQVVGISGDKYGSAVACPGKEYCG